MKTTVLPFMYLRVGHGFFLFHRVCREPEIALYETLRRAVPWKRWMVMTAFSNISNAHKDHQVLFLLSETCKALSSMLLGFLKDHRFLESLVYRFFCLLIFIRLYLR